MSEPKRGRPSLYTEEIAESICERIAAGEPLAVICRDENMPGYRTVFDWQTSREDFSAAIAHARAQGHDAIAARTRETARGAGDSTGDVQRDKLIVETDLKLLAKWDRRYGDRIAAEVSGPDGGPIKTESDTAAGVAALLDLARRRMEEGADAGG